jgi:hypothetical protein
LKSDILVFFEQMNELIEWIWSFFQKINYV